MLGLSLAVVAAALSAFVASRSGPNADTLFREGQRLFSADLLLESLPYFEQAQRLAPLSATAQHAGYFEAMVYFREQRWREAEQRLRRLTAAFPEAPNAPEAFFHLGLCRELLGDLAGAREAWREATRRFPDVDWARRAAERASELDARAE
jgi:TolA-binding protein